MLGPVDRLAQLLADCRASPEDDAPRLVWADAVGGERGELVVLQCELARGVTSLERSARLRVREGELIAAHGRAWGALDGVAIRAEFRRGFVETVTIDGAVPIATVLDRAPLVRAVCCEVDERAEIDRLFAAPELAQLAGLFVGVHGPRPASAIVHPLGLRPRGLGGVVDDHLDTVTLPQLRAFGSNAIDAERLARSPIAPQLERLQIPGVRMTRSIAADLFAHLPALRALEIASHDEIIHDLIPAGIVELVAVVIDEHEIAALGRSRAAATIERLALDGSANGELRAFEAFPRLSSLDLEDFQLGGNRSNAAVLASFARLDLAASLRELSMPWPNGAPKQNTMREVAAAFGPLLELFEYPAAYAEGPALADLVAGATLVNHGENARHLPIAPQVTTGPWLVRGVVELSA
jgi:uncharacterized protein (TIGR02996 family)